MIRLIKSVTAIMALLLVSSCAMEELVDKKEVVGKYTYVFHGSNTPESKVSIGDKTDGK